MGNRALFYVFFLNNEAGESVFNINFPAELLLLILRNKTI